MAARRQKVNAETAQSLFDAAVARIDVLQWDVADRMLQSALRRQPHFPDATIQRAHIALSRGKLLLAERFFRQALEESRKDLPKRIPFERWWHDPKTRPYLRALRGVGLVAFRRKMRRQALTAFQELLRLNPDDHLGVRYFVEALLKGSSWRQMDTPGRADRRRR